MATSGNNNNNNSTSLDDSFNAGSSIDDVLSCPVCLDLYKNPRVLPNCGHSLCFDCITKILQLSNDYTRISCPECRVISALPSGAYGLKTNIQLQRTIALYETSTSQVAPSMAAGSTLSDSFHDSCPHVFLTKNPLSCEHCGTKFCNGCGIAHMEKMKVEMIALTSGFQNRLDAAKEGLEGKCESVKGLLDEQLVATRGEITETIRGLEAKIRSGLEETEKRLMAKAQEARDAKLAEIVGVMEHGSNADTSLNERINVLQTKSVLNCGMSEMSQLFQCVAQRNIEIVALEKLRTEPLNGKIAFKVEQNALEKEFLDVFNKLKDVTLKWQSVQELQNEDLRSSIAKVHAAAKSGNVAALEELLMSNNVSETTRQVLVEQSEEVEPPNNITPLMEACKSGHVEVAKYLLEKQGANVRSALARRNVSAIHLACQAGHLNVVRYLLEFDPELIKVRNSSGATPLAYAVHHGHLNVTRYLIEEKGVDVEEIGAMKTPLMEAATRGHLHIVEYLVSQGADSLARQPKTGNIAAHFAAIAGCVEVVRYFLDRRPDLLIVKNYKGLTIIDVASDLSVIRLLEALGGRRRTIPDF